MNVHGPAAPWVSGFGKDVEQLDISYGPPCPIPDYCANWRKLVLPFNRVEICDTNLWAKAGIRSESLTLCIESIDVEEIGEIQEHCRNIRCIYFYGLDYEPMAEQQTALTDVFVSYGDQWERTFLKNMGESDLKRITSACQEAKFDTIIDDESQLGPALEILGSQLESIYIEFPCLGEYLNCVH